MRLLTMLAIFAMCGTTMKAQNVEGIVPFVAYWSVGDTYDFDVTKISRSWRNGELTKNEEQHYVATFSVIDSTESTYTCRWTYENDVKSSYQIPDNLMEKFEKYELTEIEYTTDELGTFIELVNWEEVGEIMSDMIDDIVEYYSDSDSETQKNLAKTMLPIKEMYSSKQGVELLVLKEIQYFHFPMGLEFDASETLEYEDELPNLLGGKPLRADAKMYFDYLSQDEGFCSFIHEMVVNQDDAKELINQVMKTMDLDTKEVKKYFKSAVFNITDFNEFEYFYDPGIPQLVSTTRNAEFMIGPEHVKKLEEIKIKLLFED